VKQILGPGNEALDFVGTQDDRQPAWTLRVRQVFLHIPPLQDSQVEEAERRQLCDHRADGEPALFAEIDLIAPQILRTHAVQSLPNVPMEGLEDLEIAFAGRRGVVSAHELAVQTLQQYRHRYYLL
jgi:hypothetical protein